MQLSPHFTLEEFTFSETASRLGIKNDVPENLMPNAKKTAQALEIIRDILGAPITVSSCYRSQLLNKAVGGKSNSAHLNALAADFVCRGYGTPEQIVKKLARDGMGRGLVYDQLIIEYGRWVHLGLAQFDKDARFQVLTIG